MHCYWECKWVQSFQETVWQLSTKVKNMLTYDSTFRKLRSWHLVPSLQGKWMGKSGNSVRLYFGGSQITADGDCSHEIKRRLLLGRKVMTNLDSMFKAETLICQQRFVQSRLWFFLWSCMDVRVGLRRRLSTEELMLLNCGVGESWESLGLQGNPTSPS